VTACSREERPATPSPACSAWANASSSRTAASISCTSGTCGRWSRRAAWATGWWWRSIPTPAFGGSRVRSALSSRSVGEPRLEIIRELRPDVLAKGGDWKLDEIVGREDVESWGGRVVRLRQIPGARTTSILEKARS
jgi:hypothetical protein